METARAGDAGKGLAVLPDEVRNLPHRSAQAARETAALIEESISRSSQGSTRLREVTHAINGFNDLAARIKTLVEQHTRGSQEQNSGIPQIILPSRKSQMSPNIQPPWPRKVTPPAGNCALRLKPSNPWSATSNKRPASAANTKATRPPNGPAA
ncbi:MAG: hypothetical protein FJW40_12845 [Acidobacteria bacterium]|nr:hypothetical protein [Acidobacteriota bacterium]